MTSPPILEPRFLPPAGWQWAYFSCPAGRKIRYGYALPPDGKTKAIVIGLQGLGEFAEKYFEVAHDLLARNIGFCMMDWPGQGRSQRPLPNPHKRHASSFDDDVAALHVLISREIKTFANKAPLVMLAHSMGGNIGLRYLYRHPDSFVCAAFSAPMTGIKALDFMPLPAAEKLTWFLQALLGKHYVGFGGGNWRPAARDDLTHNIYSSDPVRRAVHNVWCLHDPALQVGDITYKWLHEAVKSCAFLRQDRMMRDIKTPCLFALADKERLVENATTRRFASIMPHARVIAMEDSWHEILMEHDGVRSVFFNAFFELLSVNGILRP